MQMQDHEMYSTARERFRSTSQRFRVFLAQFGVESACATRSNKFNRKDRKENPWELVAWPQAWLALLQGRWIDGRHFAVFASWRLGVVILWLRLRCTANFVICS
jgi:hypothetical protein